MKYVSFMVFLLILIFSCQKDFSEYQPVYHPCAKEIHKRVRSIRPSVLKEVNVLIAEHWQSTDLLSC